MASGCEAGKRPWWVAGFLLVVLLFPAAPAVAAPGETGKYYIVGAPAGRREYLYDIALQTMGNGNRFREIIALNKGRRQPDDATLTDGVEVAPGWILMLPADASGPGVRTGALPPIAVQRPSSPPPRPKPSITKPSITKPSITKPTITKPSATRPTVTAPTATAPTDAADVPLTGEQPAVTGFDLSRFTPYLLRVLSGALAVVLAALALVVLRRGTARRRRVPVEEGPWPPERHHTPTPAELAALVAADPAPHEAVAGDVGSPGTELEFAL